MKHIELTVGPAGADLNGTEDLVIQAAVEYVAGRGGGTVKLDPGIYHLSNSIRLCSGVCLVGSGEKTVLLKGPSVTVPIVADTDWYEWRVTVADASAFKVGGGILLEGRCPHYANRPQIVKHTIRAIAGNTLWLDDQARGYQASAHLGNFWVGYEPTASTLFPLVTAIGATDIEVANLTLDGNRGRSAYLNGNYGGALYFEDCERIHVHDVRVVNIESDGVSFQVAHDVTIERCVFDNAINALHPGSGAQRPVMRHNVIRDCDCGLTWCWGVRHGVAEGNTIEDCKVGISIGHRDNDNLMRGNTVRRCADGGLVFRNDPPHQAADNNVVEENRFEDIGTLENPGYGIDISGPVQGIVLRRNSLVCTRHGLMAAGIRLGERAGNVTLEDNVTDGIERAVEDLRRTTARTSDHV